MDVPVAQQLSRPAWLNARTVLGAMLFVLAFFAGRSVLQGANNRVPMWTAAHDLATSSTLTAADLVPADVLLSDELLDRYARTSADLEGVTLARPVRAGELIPIGWLAPEDELDARSMTVPVSPEHAVGSALRIGDRVDVFATFDAGDAGARTVPILRSAEVEEVVSATGLVSDGQALIGVTVQIDPQSAARLAFAIRVGEIDIARVDGSGAQQASSVDASDLP